LPDGPHGGIGAHGRAQYIPGIALPTAVLAVLSPRTGGTTRRPLLGAEILIILVASGLLTLILFAVVAKFDEEPVANLI
jgi:hypothetical protein